MSGVISKIKENENAKLFIKICLTWIGTTIAMMIVGLIYNVVRGTEMGYLDLLQQWDAKRYRYIVDNGYTFPQDNSAQANWAFFPLYVLACMAIKFITFGLVDTRIIGMVVSSICIIIASYFAYKLIDDEKRGMRIVVLLIAGPYSFYFASMMTEAMFLMFTVLFFYCCKKKRFLLAGIMSACASGTRIVGCLLVFSLIIELYREISAGCKPMEGVKNFIMTMLKTPKYIMSVLLCPLGTFAYMLFLYFFCGDPWAFKNVQIAWRNPAKFPVIGVLWEACSGSTDLNYFTFMGWMCLIFIGVYIYMYKKKHYAMATFGLSTLLVAISSHVMSTIRFTVGTFVIYIGAHEIMKFFEDKPWWIKWPIRVLAIIFTLIMLVFWYKESSWVM